MTTGRQAALVTGAAGGIGLSIAIRLASAGFDVALNDLADGERLDLAAERVAAAGGRVAKVPGDVGSLAAHAAMLDEAEAAIGPLSTLVNNAGVSVLSRGDLLDVTEESYDRCMAVNAKAHFFLSQAFARRIVKRDRGDGRFYSLIGVTSSNAVAVAVQRSEYCASKAAAAMIAKAFAVRLGRENVAVYDVQPGLIETDMTRVVKDVYQRRIDEDGLTLLPRMGQPDDVGRIVAALASGALPYTTGHVISADAGMLVSRY
ncbi:3-ketoacyl-ACP reductase [Labrys monachus]|uniref:NAD(P)-dependent dehydrogenase (Short-subunit alcohol dehydrogenase family) n=1 Tax=Labrys monachus TaxID=217067 RepID=A0ABU0F8P7_9HYPH|nr:3-ketoacyl-ACP reductase [Labrys monachus]MDQ0390986.1 NAD(P)-dependent dehydrogenase (short-subunit alcohol dehydrogenase family) [Labrys monachus]